MPINFKIRQGLFCILSIAKPNQEPRVKKIETCIVQTSANFLLLKIILSSLKISDINKTYINNRNRQKCELLSTLF